MRASIVFATLMSVMVSALPTTKDLSLRAESYETANDGRGATIWKQQDLSGDRVPDDQIAIPANDFCTDLNNIVGGWDCKVRSLAVSSGHKCKFYTDYGCSSGKVLELGSKDKCTIKETLPAAFDLKIHSVYCSKI